MAGAHIHIIIGEDEFLVGEAAKKVVGDGVGLELVDSRNSTNADLQLADLRRVDESFMTPPFFDPKKVTWWKNVHFLPQSGKGSSEEVKSALEKFAAKLAAATLPENQHFLLTGPKLMMTSVFAKTLKGAAEIIEYKSGKPWEQQQNAVARLPELAADLKLVFAPGVDAKFVARVGCDTRSLLHELEKLRDYLGGDGGTVTAEAVDAITSPGVGVEPEVWAITDAIGARKTADAVAALGRFAGDTGFSILATNVIEKLFRQLSELKDAEERGFLDDAVKEMELTPFAARKLRGFLRNWRLMELRVARKRFLDLRELSVSSSVSTDELVVIETVRACRGSARRT